MLFSVPAPNRHFGGFIVTERHLQKFNETADREQAIKETMSLWEKIKDCFSDGVYKQALGCLYDLVQAKNIINDPETSVDDRASQIALVKERVATLKALAPVYAERFKTEIDKNGLMVFCFGKVENEPLLSFPMQEFTDVRAAKCWESIDGYFDKGNKTQAKTILNSLFHPKYTYKERIVKFAGLAKLANAGEQYRFQIGLRSLIDNPTKINVGFSIVGADIVIDGQPQPNVTAIPGAGTGLATDVMHALVSSKISYLQLKNCSTGRAEQEVEAFMDVVMAKMPKNWAAHKSCFSKENQGAAKKIFDEVFEAGTPDLVIMHFSRLAKLANQDKRDLFKISVSGSKSELGAGKIRIDIKLDGTSVLRGVCDVCEVAEQLLSVAGLPQEGSEKADKLNAGHALGEMSGPEKTLLGKMLITLYMFDGHLRKCDETIGNKLTMMRYYMARDHVNELYDVYRRGESIDTVSLDVHDHAPSLLKTKDEEAIELDILKPLNFGNRGYMSKFGWVGYIVTPASADTAKTVKFLMVHPLIQIALTVPLPVMQGEESQDDSTFGDRTCQASTLTYLSAATNYIKFLYQGNLEDGKPRKPNEEIQSVLKEIYDMHGGTLLIGERNALCSDPEGFKTSPWYKKLHDHEKVPT